MKTANQSAACRKPAYLVLAMMLAWQLAAAAEVTYVYDEAGRLKEVVFDDTTKRSYSLDPAGNRKQVTSTLPAGILQFTTASPSPVSEAAGSFSIAVTRSGASNGDITVAYATANGTASSSQDYMATSGTLSWTSGESAAKTITVPITNDSTFENPETFTLTISAPSGGAVLGTPSQVTVTINDDDAVSFSVANVSVNEGDGNATVTIAKSNASALTHSVSYATANGTATAGSDYTTSSGSLAFSSAESTRTFTVPITSDTLYEGNELFTVSLSSPTAGATLGASSATVTILEDDAPPAFSVSSQTMTEPPHNSMAGILVTRSGSTVFTHTVAYATSDGTATAGQDYASTSGTLTFLPGETSKPLPFTLHPDAVYEGSHYFYISLSSPSNGATVASSPATITIQDSLTPPTFTVAQVWTTEAAGAATFTVYKSGQTELAHNVNYATSGGTASAGADYTATSGTLSFAAGSSTATFTVAIVDDSTLESTETIGIVLGSPTNGATLGSPSTANLVITDNDVPAVTISNMQFSSSRTSPTATASYQLSATGDINISPPLNPSGMLFIDAGDWLSPKVPNASAFEVFAQQQQGSNCSSGPLNSWTALTPGITWSAIAAGGPGGTRNCVIQITIRNAATQIHAGTALIIFTAVINN